MPRASVCAGGSSRGLVIINTVGFCGASIGRLRAGISPRVICTYNACPGCGSASTNCCAGARRAAASNGRWMLSNWRSAGADAAASKTGGGDTPARPHTRHRQTESRGPAAKCAPPQAAETHHSDSTASRLPCPSHLTFNSSCSRFHQPAAGTASAARTSTSSCAASSISTRRVPSTCPFSIGACSGAAGAYSNAARALRGTV